MESKLAGTVGVIFVVLSITVGLSGKPGEAAILFVISLALFWKSATAKD